MILKVASFKVAGLNDLIKRKSIFTFLKSKTYHVVFLQETHVANEVQKLWEKNEGIKFFGATVPETLRAWQYFST